VRELAHFVEREIERWLSARAITVRPPSQAAKGNGIYSVPASFTRCFWAWRLDSTTPDGLGLGLFVVRRAVDLLGHRIEVSSTVRRGSRFSVLAKAANA
jgi:hypothetical protein